jgi:hypothetical protein
MVRSALGSDGGPPALAVANLGVGFTSGRAACTAGAAKMRQQRFRALKPRVARILRLLRAGAQAQRIARPTITSASLYAGDVTGVPDSVLESVRRTVGLVTPPAVAGRSLTLALAIEHEPALWADSAPIFRWARACWLQQTGQAPAGYPSLVDLSRSFIAALTNMRVKPSWLAFKGTTGGLVRTMTRIGWKSCTVTGFIDDTGAYFDARVDSPETLRAAAQRSSHRRLIRRLHLKDVQGNPIINIQTSPMKNILRSKMATLSKAVARKLFAGGYCR